MRRRLLAWLFLIPSVCLAEGTEFWLSPSGSDAGPGTKAQPFATLERAREALRKARGQSAGVSAVVHLLPGTYPRSRTFELTAQDGGAVTYRAEGAVVLRAGTPVPASAFRLVTDSRVLARMDAAARGKTYELDLRSAGIRNVRRFPDHFSGAGGLCELHWNGRRLPLSRWPNETDATMAQVLERGDESAKTGHGGVFVAREDRVARWNVTSGVWVEGYWRVPWAPSVLRVSSIDPATRAITLAVPIGGGIGSKYAKSPALGDGKEPWWAVNLLEEIDRPGEWCVDFEAQKLYLWAPSVPAEATVSIADMDAPMVVAQGAKGLVLEGLVFEQGLGNAIEIRGGEGVLVTGCVFRALGGSRHRAAGVAWHGLRDI